MNNQHDQACFLIEALCSLGLVVESDGAYVTITSWTGDQPGYVPIELLESVRCLKPEMLEILEAERDYRSSRARIAKERKHRRGNK